MNTTVASHNNFDPHTVSGFGDEWTRFDQTKLDDSELLDLFQNYFDIFPWDKLSQEAVGFDLGCGSGRWAKLVSPRVGRLHCIDASEQALSVAKKNLAERRNCDFHLASVGNLPLKDSSMDFGYSLGVLHHVPDTQAGISAAVKKLKPGAPFLLYLYYAFDGRPVWFRMIWKISDFLRRVICKMPRSLRHWVTQLIAIFVYWPLARFSRVLEKLGFEVSNFPLSSYRNRSFYTMRTDARDRFGTRLEQRFTAAEIKKMMIASELENITFMNSVPYWCALGYKRES